MVFQTMGTVKPIQAILIVLLLGVAGCSHEVTIQQHFADGTVVNCTSDEVNTSWRNSSVITSCLPQPGTLKINPLVSVGVGMSVTSAVEAAAVLVPKPLMAKAPTLRDIFTKLDSLQALLKRTPAGPDYDRLKSQYNRLWDQAQRLVDEGTP